MIYQESQAAPRTIYDQCKAVDSGTITADLRVRMKHGGKSVSDVPD